MSDKNKQALELIEKTFQHVYALQGLDGHHTLTPPIISNLTKLKTLLSEQEGESDRDVKKSLCPANEVEGHYAHFYGPIIDRRAPQYICNNSSCGHRITVLDSEIFHNRRCILCDGKYELYNYGIFPRLTSGKNATNG